MSTTLLESDLPGLPLRHRGKVRDVFDLPRERLPADAPAGDHLLIVATDRGIFYKMQQAAPGKKLIAAPTLNRGACNVCAHCPWMAMNGLQNLLAALENPQGHEVEVDTAIIERARVPIERMLAFSRGQGLVRDTLNARIQT